MEALCQGGGIVEALNTNVFGNGTQTLVLAHGFGSDQTVWHYLIPYLALYFKVVVFDMVYSPNVDPNLYDPKRYSSSYSAYVEDLVCLLDHLGEKKTIYLGHSMSAMVGCIASTQRQDLFQHLILLGGSPRYLNDTNYTGGFTRAAIDELFYQVEYNYTNWVSVFTPLAVGVNDSSAIAEAANTVLRMDPKISLDVLKTVLQSDYRRILPQVVVQSSIISSKIDILIPIAVPFYIKENIGSPATVNILDTEGHLTPLTAYPLILKVLKEILSNQGLAVI